MIVLSYNIGNSLFDRKEEFEIWCSTNSCILNGALITIINCCGELHYSYYNNRARKTTSGFSVSSNFRKTRNILLIIKRSGFYRVLKSLDQSNNISFTRIIKLLANITSWINWWDIYIFMHNCIFFNKYKNSCNPFHNKIKE